ncbi:TNF receptor-associated factor 6-B-like isoform X2 [Amblyomma americanum]
MKRVVIYRDLSGGPVTLNFIDKLPLRMLCSKCGMLSKDMFEDPLSHVFCSVCIFESSGVKKIHCRHENKEVSVDEMVPSVEVITFVKVSLVFCPNNGDDDACSKYCCLKDLERHYLECEQTNILCSSCKGNVKGRGWVQHTMSCEQHVLQCRYCAVAVPRHRLEEHERVCNENPGAIWEVVQEFVEPGNTEKQLKIVSQIKSKHAAHENKSQQVKATDGSKPAVINTDNEDHIMKCQFCERRVKKKNVCKHEELCQKKSKPLPTNSTTASMNEAPEPCNRCS